MYSDLQTLEFNKICDKIAECAACELGKELSLSIQPIDNTETLIKVHSQITELVDIISYDQSLPIDGIKDIRSIITKVRPASSVLNPVELGNVLSAMSTTRRLERFFSSRIVRIPNLWEIVSHLNPVPALEKEIERCIDTGSGEVKDNASKALADIRSSINRTQAAVRKKMDLRLNQFSEQGMLQDNVISVRDGRYVLIVKEEYKRKVKGLVHGQSASGSSFFIEPMDVFDDNNRIRELQTQELREIEKILLALSDLVRENLEQIKNNTTILAEIDFVYAKAIFSRMLNATQPEICDENVISIAQGRHPLLILRVGEKHVVSFDVTLGEKIFTYIISGPNAGGKTVALKSIGLLTIMARCGIHIPALPHSKIGRINRIFASIGDKQSIENDLSTFSSHIQTLADIATNADEHSLILVDEIGTGTDPEEGIAISMSLLETLTRRKCLSIVTTHLGALKAFAYKTPGVENASLEFDSETLQATYRFRTGIPGSSYAFEIAHRMGYPDELLTQARVLVGKNKDKLEGLIFDLEQRVHEYNRLNTDLRVKETGLDSLQKLYSERSETLKREERKIKSQAVKEAEEIINQANTLVEKTVREIREQEARREVIQNAKTVIDEHKNKIKIIKKQVEIHEQPKEEIKVIPGDAVKWSNNNSVGTVLTEADKKGRVYIQLDGVKMLVKLADLHKANRKDKRSSAAFYHVEEKEIYSSEIDLRGMRSEEACDSVDRFIYESILVGFHEIRVIHGKGTGKLRKDITELLKNHKEVQQFRLGNWNEGDTGVTVVELKKH